MLNSNGQPLVRRYSKSRLIDREIDELIGLSKGVLADGVVTQQEAEFLLDWVQKHKEAAKEWPVNVLYERLSEFLADGVLDSDEEGQLLDLLVGITGISIVDEVESTTATLPLCEPPPEIDFESVFVFTGKFASGTRSEVQQAAANAGGSFGGNVTKKTTYIVIGALSSSDWIHATWGRKIEKAIKLRDEGQALSILSEEYWLNQLNALVDSIGA